MAYLNSISLSWSAKMAARRTSNSFNLDSNSSFKFCSSTAKSSSLCLLNSNLVLKSSEVYKCLEAREAGLSSAGGLDVWQGSEEVSKTEYVGDFEKNVLESGKQLTLCGQGMAVRPPFLTAILFFFLDGWLRLSWELVPGIECSDINFCTEAGPLCLGSPEVFYVLDNWLYI